MNQFDLFIGHYVEVHTIQTHTVMTGNLKEVAEDCIVLRERYETKTTILSA